MRKTLLAILGGPVKEGSAAALLDIAIRAAKSNGWHVDFIWLYEQKIASCRGCMSCRESGICTIEDDIHALRKKLISCDAIVLAAPTYFANVPGVVKNMFDRLVGAVTDNTGGIVKPRLRKEQRYLLLTTCNTPYPMNSLLGQSRGALRAMRAFFKASGMREMGWAVMPRACKRKNIPGSIKRRIERFWT